MFDIIEVIPYFATFLPAEQETNVLSEKDNLYTSLYGEVIFVSVAFYIVDPTIGTE